MRSGEAINYRQFDLSSGTTFMTTWLEDDDRLRVGAKLTLKHGDGVVWDVEARHPYTLDAPPDKSWKVGGLV